MILVLLILAPTAGHADQRHLISEATSLAIDAPCARSVAILPDDQLGAQIVADAAADHPEETAQLTLSGAPDTHLRIARPSCWAPEDDPAMARTLDLAIRVPRGLPLTIEEHGTPTYTIGPVGGPLTFRGLGSMTVSVAKITALTIGAVGRNQIDVAEADGPMRLSLSVAGSIRVGGGTGGPLDARILGDGTISVAAEVTAATLNVAGAGTITLDHATGPVTQNASPDGHIVIHQ